MKLMIIGLDGATWRVMDPLLAEGRLPNIARLMEGGTHGVSRAFGAMLSPIMWTSIATGKLPEKHGVSHFFDTAKAVRSKRLWDILERYDQPVGLWSWPVTWPPRPINGFIVPSLFARANDTYPADLRFIKDLEEGMGHGLGEQLRLVSTAARRGLQLTTLVKMGRYFMARKLGRLKNKDDDAAQLRFLKLDVHLDLYTWLVKKYNPYFTSFYLNQTDALAHRFWDCYEPELFPEVEPERVKKYKGMIPYVYELADHAIGRLLSLTDEETLVVVLSDHGFEAAPSAGKNGKTRGRILGNKLIDALALGNDVSYVNHRNSVIMRISRRRLEIMELLHRVRVVEIDEPLLRLVEENTGEVLVKVARRRRFADQDLATLSVDWPGATKPVPFLELVHISDASTPGVHHLDGIVVFHGPGVRRGGTVTDGSILDVAPTVLALLGMPVARDMDGKVLTEAIAPGFSEKTPITYVDTYDTDFELAEAGEDEPVSPELMKRLRDLGYIE